MSYQPNHYDIQVKPIFVTAGIDNPFEGLSAYEKTNPGANYEYRFIVNTLRDHFGDAIDFEIKDHYFTIAMLSNAQMKILRGIFDDTFEFPVKYGRSQFKFEIGSYKYDGPPCNGTPSCDCIECMNRCECAQCAN